MRTLVAEKEKKDPLTKLYKEVERLCGFEPVPFPSQVKTPHGQLVAIREDNLLWVERIRTESICYGAKVFSWSQRINTNPIIEWAARQFVIDGLQIRIELRPIKKLLEQIERLKLPNGHSSVTARQKVVGWVEDVVRLSNVSKDASLLEGLIAFIEFCVENEIPGFDDRLAFTIKRIPRRRASGSTVTMFDEERGSFTREELALINAAVISSADITVEQRAMIFICRDWGLRPIQLALISLEDIGTDRGGPFIKIASVKGRVRSHLRRNDGNLKKRYIADDTYESIREVIRANRPFLDGAIESISERHGLRENSIDIIPPLFPRLKNERLTKIYLSDKALAPYVLHSHSHQISFSVRRVTQALSIAAGDSHESLLEISATRFRKTKGTLLVLQGCSPEEVAEALDHQRTSSIAHYFNNTPDLESYVNESTMGSKQIRNAVAQWHGAFATEKDLHDVSAGEARVVANLGVCLRTDDCPAWPTVSCYACKRFRPYKSGNHEAALQDLKVEYEKIKSASSGPARSQLEIALKSAEQLVDVISREA